MKKSLLLSILATVFVAFCVTSQAEAKTKAKPDTVATKHHKKKAKQDSSEAFNVPAPKHSKAHSHGTTGDKHGSTKTDSPDE